MTTIKTKMNGFFLWLGDNPGREKITFGVGEKGVHYTIIFKGDKKVLDIHKTIELGGDKKEYEQILEMRWFTLIRFILKFHEVNICLLRKYWFTHRINLGKLGHHNLVLFPLKSDETSAQLFIDNKRDKQMKFRKEIPLAPFLDMFVYPNEVHNSKQKAFWVYSTKKGRVCRQGLIFQNEADKRPGSYYFIPNRMFGKFIRANQLAVLNILNQLDFKNKCSFITQFKATLK